MANELSDRFRQAVEFLKRNGYAKNDSDIARTINVLVASISNSATGYRPPSIELMLALCDHYPINFWWLRSGEGDMIGNGDRAIALLQKIAKLEGEIAELKGKK